MKRFVPVYCRKNETTKNCSEENGMGQSIKKGQQMSSELIKFEQEQLSKTSDGEPTKNISLNRSIVEEITTHQAHASYNEVCFRLGKIQLDLHCSTAINTELTDSNKLDATIMSVSSRSAEKHTFEVYCTKINQKSWGNDGLRGWSTEIRCYKPSSTYFASSSEITVLECTLSKETSRIWYQVYNKPEFQVSSRRNEVIVESDCKMSDDSFKKEITDRVTNNKTISSVEDVASSLEICFENLIQNQGFHTFQCNKSQHKFDDPYFDLDVAKMNTSAEKTPSSTDEMDSFKNIFRKYHNRTINTDVQKKIRYLENLATRVPFETMNNFNFRPIDLDPTISGTTAKPKSETTENTDSTLFTFYFGILTVLVIVVFLILLLRSYYRTICNCNNISRTV
ncbi:hypothetical protein LSTR_LSTR007146 [Laodelphax striatellus]|uniref:Uncharacterized protein n=1 Tax=Laodelphax striatellus TaxID=195883 RepID=A0A482WW69_LAOST|nr:hypothetical protein LSTR_LSTR007146 [Laodelphax striatellus]